jgi:hypothetical protein
MEGGEMKTDEEIIEEIIEAQKRARLKRLVKRAEKLTRRQLLDKIHKLTHK